jgi:pimeloyl-ACP methyl ester carboxylesterase
MSGDFQEITFRMADGVDLYARDYAPQGEASGKPPVLCLHGLTRNSRDFEDFAPKVAALGRRVLAMDMRGRGRSGHDPNPARYVPPVYAGDVGAFLTAQNISGAVFVGTSMGGLITMLLAAMAPNLVAGAVLNDVGPRLEQAALDRIGSYVGAPNPPAKDWAEAARRCELINSGAFPNADETFWLAFARRTHAQREEGIVWDYDPDIAAPFKQDYAKTQERSAFDLTPYFDALARKPLLTVRGGISDLLSADGLNFMRARAPNMRAVEVADVGHAPFLTEPQAWAAVAAFLAEV